jgi:hypothetical protein
MYDSCGVQFMLQLMADAARRLVLVRLLRSASRSR